MPTGRTQRRPAFLLSLDTQLVRQAQLDNQTFYALPDVLRLLIDAAHPETDIRQLLQRQPALAQFVQDLPFSTPAGTTEILPASDLKGLLNLAQYLRHPRIESLRRWLASCAANQIEEESNPELAVARARRQYEHLGYPRQWIDQRLRSISGRAEIVSEWHRRGAHTTDHYRELTNALMLELFNMDAETLRQHKGLFGRENLRDHMTEMELSLLTLAESTAAALHRSRDSRSFEQLESDTRLAGHIAADTRLRIQQATGQPIISPLRKPPAQRRNPPSHAHPDTVPGREVLYRHHAPDDPTSDPAP